MNNLDLLNPPEWYIITCSNCSCTVLVEDYPDIKRNISESYCNKCHASYEMSNYINSCQVDNIRFTIYSNLSYNAFISGYDIYVNIYHYSSDNLVNVIHIDNPNINSYEQINKIFLDFVKKYLDNIIFE